MNYTPALLIALLTFGAASCTPKDSAQPTSSETAEDTELTESPSADRPKTSLSKDQAAEFMNVLQINERLHAAFFDYDPAKVEQESQAMVLAINNLSEPELLQRLQPTQKNLGKISAAAEREENNKTYHLVSLDLIQALGNYDVGAAYKTYSCPMVKMQWVQNTTETAKVQNPYAPEMPSCGEKLN